MASRIPRTAAIALLPLLALTASCDGERLSDLRPGASSDVTDAPQPTGPPDSGTPETAAPETAAPETAAPDTAAPETDAPPGTDAATDDDGGGIGTGLLIVLILLGVGVLVAVIMAATRRGTKSADVDRRRPMLSTARWIHDQLSIEILALPAADAQARWNAERVRFDQLVIDLRSIAPSQKSPATWDELAVAVGTLASSLDSAVRVRASPDADPDLARESVSIANRHRGDLQRTLLAAEAAL